MKDTRKRRWGIVDIGSNTIRLCVYDIDDDGGAKRIASVKVPTALASYVDDDGMLSEDGVKAGSKSVHKLCQMAELMDCDGIFPFATAALRNCANSSQAVEAVQEKAGYPIRVLSGAEEARLSLRGALSSVDFKSGLFFDIGGGSTELMELRKGRYADGESIPMGSLTSWSRGVEWIMPTANELEALSSGIGILLDGSKVKLAKHARVCGIGGTMRLALKVARELRPEGDRRTVSLGDLDGIVGNYLDAPEDFARMLLQKNPARIHTFLPGCTIAREILVRTGCDSLTVAKTGVREGYLARLLQHED